MLNPLRRRGLLKVLPAAACALAAPRIFAQAYPAKPIKLIVPFPSGAGDQVARLLAARLSVQLGQTVVVENVPGAAGVIGTMAALKAPADGYTLVTATNSMVNGPLLGQPTPFNALTDLQPIALTATGPTVLGVASSSPYRTLAELVAAAKAKPGSQTFASAGNGSLGHLYGEFFKSAFGINALHVPYKGGGAALVDVMSGQVSWVWDVLGTSKPQVLSGRLRGLAISGAARSPQLPDVPCMGELGHPEFNSAAWFSIMAAAAVPKPVVQHLNAEVNKALQHPEVVATLANLGFNPEGGPPERWTGFYQNEVKLWGKVIREANIKSE